MGTPLAACRSWSPYSGVRLTRRLFSGSRARMRSSTTGIGVFQTSNRRRKCAGRGPPRPDANRVLTTSIAGIEVGRIGLGCFALSGGYGPPDDSTAAETIHPALQPGVNRLDTPGAYAAGEN